MTWNIKHQICKAVAAAKSDTWQKFGINLYIA
jgi:hypothetical protein